MRTLLIGLVGLGVAGFGLLTAPESGAIIIRHDVPDAEYVVVDAEYPALVGRGVTATGVDGEAGGHTDGKLRRATNMVSAVDDQFLEVVFERPGQDGVTDLEGVGAAGDSACPMFLDVDGKQYVAGLNSWGDGGRGIGIGQYGARDYQTRVSRFAGWLDEVIGSRPRTDPPGDDPTGEGWSSVVLGSIFAFLLVIGAAVAALRWLRTRERRS